MTTSSVGPGTLPVLQLLAASQEPLVVLIQSTVERSWRGSRNSMRGVDFRYRREHGRLKLERARKNDRRD